MTPFQKNIKLVSINLLVLGTIFISIEAASFLGRKLTGRPSVGFLYSKRLNKYLADDCQRMRTHPILSHVHDHKNQCQVNEGVVDGPWVIYPNQKKKSKTHNHTRRKYN